MSKYRSKISHEAFERIEMYLLGGLDAGEREAFERAISADDTLRHEVELQRMLAGAVELGMWKAAGIAGGHVQPRLPIPPAKPSYYRWYVAAAILIIGLGLGGWWFYGQQPTAKEALYAVYFRPDPGLPVVMGNDSARYLFNEGMVSYKEGNHAEAIGVWERLVSENGATDTLQYYIGVAYLNMEHQAEALAHLVSVAENNQSVFREKSIWYMALMRLKEKDYAHVKRLLMELPESEEAIELLDRIGD